jgi:hypothetical protein
MVLPVAEANMIDLKSLYQAGTWAADAGGQHVTGTYMSVVVQDGANWKYRADTWNMMPPPAVAAASATTGSGSTNEQSAKICRAMDREQGVRGILIYCAKSLAMSAVNST